MPSSASPPSRHAQLSALRRKLILQGAQRVFEREGLEQTTIRAIAREAGCTTGAIYPWFSGKEAIYAALLEESLERLHVYLTQALDAAAAPQAARAVIHAFFHYYAERPTEFSLGMYLFQGLGQRGLGLETDARLNDRLRECVDLLGHGLSLTKRQPVDLLSIQKMNAFTYLMGLLLLRHTRRLKSLDQQASVLLDSFCLAQEHN